MGALYAAVLGCAQVPIALKPAEHADAFLRSAWPEARSRWSPRACLSHFLVMVNDSHPEQDDFSDNWETVSLTFSSSEKPGQCLVAQSQRLISGPSPFNWQTGFAQKNCDYACIEARGIGAAEAFRIAVREDAVAADKPEVSVSLLHMTPSIAPSAEPFRSKLLGRTVWYVSLGHMALLYLDARTGRPLLKVDGGNWDTARWVGP